MVELHDLARRGAVVVLAELARREPLTMDAFTDAARLTTSPAKLLRLDLEAMGLIAVEEAAVRGIVKELRIRLTPLGRDVATRLADIEEILRAAGASKKPGRARASRSD